MNFSRLWIAATIIAIFILVGFVFFVPHTRDTELPRSAQSVETPTPTVTLHDTFKKGIHTITGSIEAPNACTTLSADASLIGDASMTQSILVTISMPEDVGICLQKPTTIKFSTTITAPASLPISAIVNDRIASTTGL